MNGMILSTISTSALPSLTELPKIAPSLTCSNALAFEPRIQVGVKVQTGKNRRSAVNCIFFGKKNIDGLWQSCYTIDKSNRGVRQRASNSITEEGIIPKSKRMRMWCGIFLALVCAGNGVLAQDESGAGGELIWRICSPSRSKR